MSKIFWYDVETTGLNAKHNDIIQLGYNIEIDDEVVDEGQFFMRPHGPESSVSQQALKVNGRNLDEIFSFPDFHEVMGKITDKLTQYVDRYKPADKFVQAGYNTGFDSDFLRASFEKNGDKYFGSYFHWPKIDVAHTVAEFLIVQEIPDFSTKNFKLESIAEALGIPLKAHDALNDIRATRSIYRKLTGKEVLFT